MIRYNKRSHEVVFSVVERLAARSTYVGRAVEIAGNVAGHALWQRAQGLEQPRFWSREHLWRQAMFPRLHPAPAVLEFGVASGAATQLWLKEIADPQLSWHGFDVFTGLPTAWARGGVEYSKAGRFDTGGEPPAIIDPRLSWHIGLIEDTLPQLEVEPLRQLCVLVDVDLYAPSRLILEWLQGRLKPGDLLYFDELYDGWHERRALDELLTTAVRLGPLGSTGMSAAFEVIAI